MLKEFFKRKLTILIWIYIVLCCAISCTKNNSGHYKATWLSLEKHPIPDWFYDAKFGIYTHFGLYSVPAYNSPRYADKMYEPGTKEYEYHKKHFGDQSKFGYKDFLPMFKAEKFDPQEWADVMAKSGAKFAGMCVVHHDGFLMWDSDVHRWNVGDKGPKRDIYGELAKEIRKRGLKLIATFHHRGGFDDGEGDSWLPKKVTEEQKNSWDIFDPDYYDLYWNIYTSTKEKFVEYWEKTVKEVIDKYKPDLLWFDGMRGAIQNNEPPDEVVRSLFAYYFNMAEKENRPVTICNKLPATPKEFSFPESFGVLCYENNRDRPDIPPRRPWLTDRAIGYPWCYVPNKKYISTDNHINTLVDIVSRGGVFLLSLTPKGNGEIPQEEKKILREIGDWLEVNGEAIYGTRPWLIFGEGPSKLKSIVATLKKDGVLLERHSFSDLIEYRSWKKKVEGLGDVDYHIKWDYENLTSNDIRFTRKGNVLYAIALDWPENGQIVIKSLNSKANICRGDIDSVFLLGYKNKLKFIRNEKGLIIQLPEERPCRYAYAFKIIFNGKLFD